MPCNKVFDVPDGSIDFIIEWMETKPWHGGIFFKSCYTKFYKIEFDKIIK